MSESEIKKAESDVEKSTANFEDAVGQLEEKIDDTADKVKSAVEMVKKPKERMEVLMHKAQSAASEYGEKTKKASMRLVQQASSSSRQVADRVKENPQPFIITALSVLAATFLATYFERRRGKRRLAILER